MPIGRERPRWWICPIECVNGEVGLDLAIVILPPPHDSAVLTPLADALAQLR